jgi:hypothetical protein
MSIFVSLQSSNETFNDGVSTVNLWNPLLSGQIMNVRTWA